VIRPGARKTDESAFDSAEPGYAIHVEQPEHPDEREQEIKHDLDELDKQAEEMDERTDELQKKIDESPDEDD
jgi:hypothetical protein